MKKRERERDVQSFRRERDTHTEADCETNMS